MQNEFTANIGGDLSFPKRSGPFPVVILLHPCGGLDAAALTTLRAHSRELLSNGFATLILDSYGPRNLMGGKACGGLGHRSVLVRQYELRRDDAFNAMAALQRHANISKDNIFLVGLSDGASAALLSAKGGPTDHFRAIAAFYPNCEKLLGGVGYVYKSPTIVFVGEKDDWSPPAECIKSKIAGVVAGAEFEVISYPNTYHGFDQPRPMRKVLGYNLEFSMVGKWIELLTNIAPSVRRVVYIYNLATVPSGFLRALDTLAPSIPVQLVAAPVHNSTEIDAAVAEFVREPGGGLMMMPDTFNEANYAQIIALAAKHKLPAVYPHRFYDGLISYGPDLPNLFKRAASYVDRILRGEKPGELPVQAPTKYELIINLKTAKALGLIVPQSLVVAADEVND